MLASAHTTFASSCGLNSSTLEMTCGNYSTTDRHSMDVNKRCVTPCHGLRLGLCAAMTVTTRGELGGKGSTFFRCIHPTCCELHPKAE